MRAGRGHRVEHALHPVDLGGLIGGGLCGILVIAGVGVKPEQSDSWEGCLRNVADSIAKGRKVPRHAAWRTGDLAPNFGTTNLATSAIALASFGVVVALTSTTADALKNCKPRWVGKGL